MKKRTKELIIIIPLISFGIFIAVGTWISSMDQPIPDQYITESSCQEGWYKYEVDGGTLCSETELTNEELDGIKGNLGIE